MSMACVFSKDHHEEGLIGFLCFQFDEVWKEIGEGMDDRSFWWFLKQQDPPIGSWFLPSEPPIINKT